MFILGLILVALAVVALLISPRLVKVKTKISNNYRETEEYTDASGQKIARVVSLVLGVLGIGIIISTTFYVQDVGEAKVQTDISGKIVSTTTEAGFHAKYPWSTMHTFNIRNQLASFINSADAETEDNAGNERTGPYITVQDAEGVSSNVSLNLQYSIDPKAVETIYTTYKTEEAFKSSFVANSVRNVVREAPNEFDTLQLLTERGAVQQEVTEKLIENWEGSGVVLDNLALQEINPPDSVRESYAAAQQAQINVTKAQADLEAQQVSAQQQVQEAQATADSNRILNSQPLNGESIQQKYIDALKESGKNGGLIVVPEGSTPLLNVGK